MRAAMSRFPPTTAPTSFLSPARCRSALATLSLHDALPICHGRARLERDHRSERPRFAGSLSLSGKGDRKSTRLNSSHVATSYAVFCLKKKSFSGGSSAGIGGSVAVNVLDEENKAWIGNGDE